MKKWNMIIDVAECTNCQLCTLATMDEYVGNDWPGYTAPMPKHGHKWINILQKERGQMPMIDIAYVPTMCNHCDDAPCMAKGGGAITKRADGIVLIDPGARRRAARTWSNACPVRPHLVERGAAAAAASGRSTPTSSTRAGSRPAASSPCPTGAMRAIKVEDDEMARMAREQGLEVMKPELGTKPAGLLPQPLALLEMLHRRHARGRGERRRRLRRGRERAKLLQGRPSGRGDHERQLRRLQIRQARRELRRLCGRDFHSGGKKTIVDAKLGAQHQSGRDTNLG